MKMKKMKNLKKMLFACMLIIVVSCSKDDDTSSNRIETHPNGILKLTTLPETIIESSFTVDTGSTTSVLNISLEDINDNNFFQLNAGNKKVAISVDDEFNPNGEIVWLIIGADTYQGQNFIVEERDTSLHFTGQVTNINNENDIKSLSVVLQESQLGGGTSSYTVTGENAFLAGDLGTYTYNQILEINSTYPEVKTIVLGFISGSLNDDINVETGRLIRLAGYGTHLKSDSEIYSGGVDLFCSGSIRTREAGSIIGVHSWCCHEGLTAAELPTDSPAHNSQLAYFSEMLGTTNGPAFYFFTINAAPFDGEHLMTESEISQYQLITE